MIHSTQPCKVYKDNDMRENLWKPMAEQLKNNHNNNNNTNTSLKWDGAIVEQISISSSSPDVESSISVFFFSAVQLSLRYTTFAFFTSFIRLNVVPRRGQQVPIQDIDKLSAHSSQALMTHLIQYEFVLDDSPGSIKFQ